MELEYLSVSSHGGGYKGSRGTLLSKGTNPIHNPNTQNLGILGQRSNQTELRSQGAPHRILTHA